MKTKNTNLRDLIWFMNFMIYDFSFLTVIGLGIRGVSYKSVISLIAINAISLLATLWPFFFKDIKNSKKIRNILVFLAMTMVPILLYIGIIVIKSILLP